VNNAATRLIRQIRPTPVRGSPSTKMLSASVATVASLGHKGGASSTCHDLEHTAALHRKIEPSTSPGFSRTFNLAMLWNPGIRAVNCTCRRTEHRSHNQPFASARVERGMPGVLVTDVTKDSVEPPSE